MPPRAAGDPAALVLVPGSLARVTAPLPSLSPGTQLMGGLDPSTGARLESVAGVGVEVGGVRAAVVAVTPISMPPFAGVVAVDFVVPLALMPGGTPVPVRLVDATTRLPLFERGGVVLVGAAPAFWSDGGRALALDADRLLKIGDESPATAGGRVILLAGGLNPGAPLAVRAGTADGRLISLQIDFAGEVGTLPGVWQMVVRLPDALRGVGSVSLVVTSGATASTQQVRLPVN